MRLRFGSVLPDSQEYERVAIYVKNACEIIQDPASNPKERPFRRACSKRAPPRGTPGTRRPGLDPGRNSLLQYSTERRREKAGEKKSVAGFGATARAFPFRAGGEGERGKPLSAGRADLTGTAFGGGAVR